ncbi:LysR family transcriptional regulator [Acidocella aminolytica]|jgi:DNA-binding transcriptional LysR family regulator|uniref:Transcriptional regulator LysR n=1 Tax=Acidocella aminolytica 101 = DSM 11237 TaxID=1120923 RepID=A0A0D6PGT8_9PROT|nr:LysR family transcriptional regulator [Acidocella aminolytica]GAN80867.1 transcriptional regulator LysR [Acidocella aminolytica 101 = DSM 11237]GBQ34236.1 LysR family transcriptional regulator [Acidocella aminolytica 101 = DSM 11237]SHE31347.1 DNA-binding transcriptional regulator, LysR family [Acidocella aminolytica 101 = DSM 11237]
MKNSFDWNDLRYFLAVARAGTISQAGRMTAADHATVARRISALEVALDTQLFVRNARGYSLTRQGERLLENAGRIEAEAGKLEEQLGGRNQGASGIVKISALEGIGNFFLAKRLSHFAVKHPRLSVELLTIQQVIAMSRRDTDIIITLSPPDTRKLVLEKLTDYRLFVFGTETYLRSKPLINSAQDLKKHDFTGYIDELVFTRGLDYLNEVEPNLRARLQCSSLHAQMEAACAGYGLCILPAFIACHRKELVPILPHSLSLRRTYWTAVHTDIAASRNVRLALNFIRKEAALAKTVFLGEHYLTKPR